MKLIFVTSMYQAKFWQLELTKLKRQNPYPQRIQDVRKIFSRSDPCSVASALIQIALGRYR